MLCPLLPSLSVGRKTSTVERPRASEGEAVTSGARCGNNGNAPQCDSGRQEQAQTQEPAIETDLPRPENLEEELSLARVLSFSQYA